MNEIIFSKGYPRSHTHCILGDNNKRLDDILAEQVKDSKGFSFDGSIIIKPEDFVGDTIAEKVIAANAYLNSLPTECNKKFVFGDTEEYKITEAITLPSNTEMQVNNCTIQLADYTWDNIVRTSNIVTQTNDNSDLAKYNGLCTCSGKVKNIKIIGTGTAKLYGPANRFVGIPTGGTSSVEWTGDYYGWRGIAVIFFGVEGFEVSGLEYGYNNSWGFNFHEGCCYGSIHDIIFDTRYKNGDGIDIENGCHDISIYNLSGTTQDDTICFGTTDPDNVYSNRYYCMHPCGYGFYDYGKEIYNISVDNVSTSESLGSIIDFVTVKIAIHDIVMSNITSVTQGSGGVIRAYGKNWQSRYTDGLFYNIYGNNIVNNAGTSMFVLNGMFHNSKFNKIVCTGTPTITNGSGVTLADANCVITNPSLS